jgi:hypothetical protein
MDIIFENYRSIINYTPKLKLCINFNKKVVDAFKKVLFVFFRPWEPFHL